MPRLSILSQAKWLTIKRVCRIAVIFGILALVAVSADAWLHTRAGLANAAGEQLGRDFVNYWSGAHLAAHGHATKVYDINAFVKYERAHTAANADFKWYSYPPTTLLLSLPLAIMNFGSALIFWLVLGVVACAMLLARTLDWRMALLAAFATPASFMNAISGQNGQFSAALLGGGVLFLDRNPRLAGVFFGMLCYKPHLAILVPFALAAGRYWRSFMAAAATMLTLIAISALLFGPTSWSAFAHNAPLNALLMEHGNSFWHRMPTVFAMARLMGGGIFAAYGAQIVSAVAAGALTVWVWRGGVSLERKGAILILATFLTTPYAWDYDLVALTFAVVWLAAKAGCEGFRPWEKIALAATITMPMILSPIATATHLQLGPAVLWCALLLTAWPATRPSGVMLQTSP